MSEDDRTADENSELKARLRELEDTLNSIYTGEVDALVVNGDIYVLESANAASNRLRQDVLGQMEDAVFAFDKEENVIYLNAAAERRYGVSSDDVLGRGREWVFEESRARNANDDDDDAGTDSSFADLASSERRAGVAAVHKLLDGSEIHVELIVSHLRDAAGNNTGTLAVVRDVSQRWHDDLRRNALAALSDKFRDLDGIADIGYTAAECVGRTLDASRAGFATIDPRTELLVIERDWNAPGVETLAGTLNLHDYGDFIDSLKRNEPIVVSDVRIDRRTANAASALEARHARALVNVPMVGRDEQVAVLYVNSGSVRQWSPEDLAFIRDVAERTRLVTERSQSAAALRESEARLRDANENLEATVQARTLELMAAEQALRQAQKMEAVGQLTGGIAHDFNNLLAGISGSLQVLRSRMGQGRLEGAERYVDMGLDAVRRAAALTQRLLAFARRQTLDPKPTDVNRLIAGMEDLIRRAAGPTVSIEVVGAGGLWSTRVDPSQLESSLLNLCINARDAMLPDGGRLTIETANKWLDDRAAAERELPPGQYVSLCVSDTGTGMSPDVIKRVFDPFFTTKPLGQGTGLGLSMVYGFVRQSGGQVRIYSELGKGTTMCLYLPRFIGDAVADEPIDGPQKIESGDGERVLVIEDEPSIRSLISEVLAEAGFHVLTAEDGQSGLRILQTNRRVDLLITDVGLPGGMNGRQVADAARVTRPDLKVLFITGYAENAAVGNGHLERGMAVLTKPFEITVLTRRVREMTGPAQTG